MNKKDELQRYDRVTLSLIEVVLAESNQALNSSWKMVKELEVSLIEAREGGKRFDDDLQKICLENLELSK